MDKNIIFLYPLIEGINNFKSSLSSDEYEIYEIDNLNEYSQIIGILDKSITISSDYEKTKRLVNENEQFIKKKTSKNILITSKEIPPHIQLSLKNKGLDEILPEKNIEKTLSLKIKIFFDSNQNQKSSASNDSLFSLNYQSKSKGEKIDTMQAQRVERMLSSEDEGELKENKSTQNKLRSFEQNNKGQQGKLREVERDFSRKNLHKLRDYDNENKDKANQKLRELERKDKPGQKLREVDKELSQKELPSLRGGQASEEELKSLRLFDELDNKEDLGKLRENKSLDESKLGKLRSFEPENNRKDTKLNERDILNKKEGKLREGQLPTINREGIEREQIQAKKEDKQDVLDEEYSDLEEDFELEKEVFENSDGGFIGADKELNQDGIFSFSEKEHDLFKEIKHFEETADDNLTIEKLLEEKEYFYYPPITNAALYSVFVEEILYSELFQPIYIYKYIDLILFNKFKGCFLFAHLDGSSFYLDFESYSLRGKFIENVASFVEHKSSDFKETRVPTWNDETFQSKVITFTYPLVENDLLKGTFYGHFEGGVHCYEDASAIEAIVMLARCLYLRGES